jgi:CRP-like cAMP-binding protein
MPPERQSSPPPLGVGRFQRLIILKTFPAYQKLPSEAVASIAEYSRDRFFRKGTFLHREGQPVSSIHFIVSGEVTTRKKGLLLRRFGPKAVVGGLSMLAEDPNGLDAVAEVDTVTIEVAAEDHFEVFEENFPILKVVASAIAAQMIEARRQMPGAAGFGEPATEAPAVPDRPLDLVERMSFIRRTMTFAEAKIDAIVDLAREAKEVRLEPGALLWKEGVAGKHFYMVVNGFVECETAAGQKFRFGPGDTVGGVDAFADHKRWFTARTASPFVALRIERDGYLDVLEDHTEMALAFLRVMARGLLMLYQKASQAEERAEDAA